MKHRLPKKIRNVQRLRLTTRKAIAIGISVSLLTIMLIVYFQIFKNDTIKAESPEILTQDELPVQMHIESPVIMESDTFSRNGVRYKIAKPLPQPQTAND